MFKYFKENMILGGGGEKGSTFIAGQERFRSIAKSYYREANAILFIYDLSLTNGLSKGQIWRFLDEIVQSPPVFLKSPVKKSK